MLSLPMIFVALACSSVNQYTMLAAPLAWRACETFIPRPDGAMVVSQKSDVFMLGCSFVEVLTGCRREPYDWLMKEDPSGMTLMVYRGHESTRNNNPLVVRSRWWRFPDHPGLVSLSLDSNCFGRSRL